MMVSFFTSRVVYTFICIICFSSLLFSMVLEFIEKLEPCPLCQSQRMVMFVVVLLTFCACLKNTPRIFRICGVFVIMLTALGSALAMRQLWLQHLPFDQKPPCMPGLNYLLNVLPLSEILPMMIMGTGSCSEVKWVFLGLSIPGWTLIIFITVLFLSITNFLMSHILEVRNRL